MALEANADTFISLFSILALLASLTSAIDIEQFMLKIKAPKGIIIGLICQYGILPITAFCVSYIFNLHSAQAVALIIVGTCPGGAMSNFWCFTFNSDLPLSIAMTTASSVLSFAFITMNGAIYIPILSSGSDKLKLDYVSLTLSVAAVLIGIVIGIIIAWKHNQKVIKFMGILGLLSMFLILIFSLINTGQSDAPLRESPPLAFVAILCMNTVALGLSFGISLLLKLKRTSAVSVAIESSNQNAPLAIAIILLSLDDGRERDLALNIPVIYMLTNVLFVVAFGVTLRRTGWLKLDENDKTMTLARIIMKWKENKQNKQKKQDNTDNDNNIEIKMDEKNNEIDESKSLKAADHQDDSSDGSDDSDDEEP